MPVLQPRDPLFVLPTRAHAQLATAAAEALDLLADMVPALLDGLSGRHDPERLNDLHRRMRAALARLEVFADEARRERRALVHSPEGGGNFTRE